MCKLQAHIDQCKVWLNEKKLLFSFNCEGSFQSAYDSGLAICFWHGALHLNEQHADSMECALGVHFGLLLLDPPHLYGSFKSICRAQEGPDQKSYHYHYLIIILIMFKIFPIIIPVRIASVLSASCVITLQRSFTQDHVFITWDPCRSYSSVWTGEIWSLK